MKQFEERLRYTTEERVNTFIKNMPSPGLHFEIESKMKEDGDSYYLSVKPINISWCADCSDKKINLFIEKVGSTISKRKISYEAKDV